MKQIYFSLLGESLYFEKLENGLDVYLIPKKEFAEYCGVYSVKFGSLNTDELLSKVTPVLPGAAHFLEHKLFESSEGSIFEKFSRIGGSVNAYTSYNQTAYYFTSCSNLLENVETLIKQVQSFDVSEEKIEKEKGIIIEELKMYEDVPDSRLLRGILEKMYKKHPIRYDIGGTIEAVKKTNKQLLDRIFENYYHPKNSAFILSGDFDPEEVMKRIKDLQKDVIFPLMEKKTKIKHDTSTQLTSIKPVFYMDVVLPKVAIGIKMEPIESSINGFAKLKKLLCFEILLEMLFSSSSKSYEIWLKKGIITESLSYFYFSYEGCFCIIINCDTPKYKIFIKEVKELINSFDILEEIDSFERIRKKCIGSFLFSLNKPSFIAQTLSSNLCDDILLFDELEALESITISDIGETLLMLREGNIADFKVLPLHLKK